MKKDDMEGIYNVACSAKGFAPNDDQFRIWWKTLGGYERADLEGALLMWFTTNTGFPMPADLRFAADGIKRERTAVVTEVLQQQICPKCKGVVQMMRPVGEQFRTWCMPCQSYRKIAPEDLTLIDAEWRMLCAELDIIFENGSKPTDCVNPQFDRAKVRGCA
jgi:hypothetical protein